MGRSNFKNTQRIAENTLLPDWISDPKWWWLLVGAALVVGFAIGTAD